MTLWRGPVTRSSGAFANSDLFPSPSRPQAKTQARTTKHSIGSPAFEVTTGHVPGSGKPWRDDKSCAWSARRGVLSATDRVEECWGP